MKILVPLIGIAWIAISCSTENDLDYNTNEIETLQSAPETNAHTYDLAGRIYRKIQDRHSGNATKTATIPEVYKKVQTLMDKYNLKEKKVTNVSQIKINPSDSSLDSLLVASPLSQPARESFSDFIYEVVDTTYPTYQDCKAYILTYESEVMQQSDWSEEDRTMILTATSLIRQTGYTLYTDREDEDWDIAIGNVYVVVAGVIENTQTAIVNALMYFLD